jgi:hypothetical protein
MNKIYDIACKGCDYVEEMWLNNEDVQCIRDKEVLCGVCTKGELYVVLGAPQFSIKGPGVYSPGKH